MFVFFQSKTDKFVIDGFPRNEENLKTWNELMGQKAAVNWEDNNGRKETIVIITVGF
jgi:hypothetical protein